MVKKKKNIKGFGERGVQIQVQHHLNVWNKKGGRLSKKEGKREIDKRTRGGFGDVQGALPTRKKWERVRQGGGGKKKMLHKGFTWNNVELWHQRWTEMCQMKKSRAYEKEFDIHRGRRRVKKKHLGAGVKYGV